MTISKKLLYFLVLSCFFSQNETLFAHSTTPIDEPEMITNQTELMKLLYAQVPTIILLKSKACPYCDSLSQAIKPYVIKYSKIDFNQVVNGPDMPLIATVKAADSSLKIPGFPTILFINKGKIVDSQIGFNKQTLSEKIAKFNKSTK